MSLINQVLKGLESRKEALPTSGPTEDLQWVNQEEPKTNYLLIGGLVVGFLTLSAGSLLGIQWLYDHAVIPSPSADVDTQLIAGSDENNSDNLTALSQVELPELLPSSSVDMQELSDSSILQESLETEIVLSPSQSDVEPLVLGQHSSKVDTFEPPAEALLNSLPSGTNRIHEFRFSNTETEARLVFELDHTLAHELQVDEKLQTHHLYLPNVYLPENQQKVITEQALIRSLQYGGTEQDLELIIDTRIPTTIYSYFLAPDDRYPRHRLVLDLMARSAPIRHAPDASSFSVKRTALSEQTAKVLPSSTTALSEKIENNERVPKKRRDVSPAVVPEPVFTATAKEATQSTAAKSNLVPQHAKAAEKKSTQVSEQTSHQANIHKNPPPLRTANRIPRKLTPTEVADRHYYQALKLIEQKQDNEAYKMLINALEHAPDHIAARERLLDLLMRTGRISEAENGLREALRMHPKQSSFAKLYARILVERNNIGGAIYILEDAKPALADDPEYHAFLAAMYQRQGDHEKAVELYQSVVTEHPFSGVWWMGLAISQEHTRDFASAIENYKQALFREGLSPELISYIQFRLKQLQLN